MMCLMTYSRNIKLFGRQSWMIAGIIVTEFLITLKFDWELISMPLPRHVVIFWSVGLVSLFLYTIWKFYIKRDVKLDILPSEKLKYQNGSAQMYQQSNGNGVSNGTRQSGRARKVKST